jgi:uncharacterized membrane protein YqjE
MDQGDQTAPGVTSLVGRLARTGLGALQNRCELLALEWQEERARLVELLMWALLVTFLTVVGVLLLTAFIIYLFPRDLRIFAAAGFTVLYLGSALVAFFNLRALLKQAPFAETLNQLKKDRVWLDSLRSRN